MGRREFSSTNCYFRFFVKIPCSSHFLQRHIRINASSSMHFQDDLDNHKFIELLLDGKKRLLSEESNVEVDIHSPRYVPIIVLCLKLTDDLLKTS